MMGSAEGQRRYDEAALWALRLVEARRATKRGFGPEADATWTAFRGDFGTSARIDLLLRDAATQWPGASVPDRSTTSPRWHRTAARAQATPDDADSPPAKRTRKKAKE